MPLSHLDFPPASFSSKRLVVGGSDRAPSPSNGFAGLQSKSFHQPEIDWPLSVTPQNVIPTEDGSLERHDTSRFSSHTSTAPLVTQFAAIIRAVLPFLAFLVVYGLNGVFPVLPRAKDAHCVRLHNVSAFEETLFGKGRAPHLVLSAANSPVLDVLSAVPYLMHYLIPVAYPLYVILFVRSTNEHRTSTERHQRIVRFYTLLGWSMWLHYAIWFVFPTAPPWVAVNLAAYHRLDPTGRPPSLDVQPREGCAFARLDQLVGIPFFRTIFAGNPIPFASLPSGHVAWPTCVLVTQMRHGCTRRRRILLAIYVIWVAWATMYSCHHYMCDIIAAVIVVFIVDRLTTRFRRFGSDHRICRLDPGGDRKSSMGLMGDRSCLASII